METVEFSKYESARILGARALQIAMNAPLLIKISEEDLEKVHYDAIKIAEIELNSGVLPISVNKPLPLKKEEKLKRTKEAKVSSVEAAEAAEKKEEQDIVEEGEIMALVKTDDDDDDLNEDNGSEEQ